MFKLFKYLKPYTWAIVLVFALLFGQAMADLALPTYTADIVNVGIQQHGIENAVPQAIRAKEMDRLTLFMSDSEKAEVLNDYILLDKQTLSPADYSNYLKIYPDLATENIYKLKTINKTENDKLNTIFETSVFVVANIEQKGISSFLPSGQTVPPGTDPFTLIAQLPASELATIREGINTQIASLPPSIVNQTAISYLSKEYNTLGMDLGKVQSAYMWHIGLIMLLLTLGSAAASAAVGFFAARIASGFARDTRQKLFTKVESFSSVEFDKFTSASLITRSTNDITQIQLLLVFLIRIVFYSPIIGVGGIILAIGQGASMSWIIAVAVVAVMAMVIIVFNIAIPKFRLMQKLVDKLNLVSREILTGVMVVRAFNTQKHEEKKFDKVNVDLTDVSLFINKILVLMMPVMMFIMNGISVLIVWVGAYQVNAGAMQVGNMIAFMQYAIQIIMAFMMVSMTFIMLPRALVSAQRIDEVLETGLAITDPESPEEFNKERSGYVEFKNVSFRYPGAEDYVLKDISFTARPKQTTAIIGSTGSGKSTLVNLIPRFYDTTEGKIFVNGTNIKEVTQHDLRDTIGYVPQKSVLFSGTIGSNLRYANEDATEEEIKKASEIAQAMEFIDASEEKFDTPASQGATNFSGGQKQRLSIARALVKHPEIFIFDDSFSALDFKTDAALRRALRRETNDATVLIVSQRIGTVMNADHIIVLDNGKIAGSGKHENLMRDCEVYKEIALSQLSKEELA